MGNVRKVEAFKILHEDCTVKKIGVDAIVAAVEMGARIPLARMRQKTRKREVVDARRVLCSLLNEHTEMNRKEIAEFVGQRLKDGKGDHAVSLHYIRTDKETQTHDANYRAFRAQITKWI